MSLRIFDPSSFHKNIRNAHFTATKTAAIFLWRVCIVFILMLPLAENYSCILLRAPASSPLFLTYISICAIFVCQDDFEHAYVCAAVSSLVILMLHNRWEICLRMRYILRGLRERDLGRVNTVIWFLSVLFAFLSHSFC
jgi:hypothetical protein